MAEVRSHVQRHARLVLGETLILLLRDVLDHVRRVAVDDVIEKIVPVVVPGFYANSVADLKNRERTKNIGLQFLASGLSKSGAFREKWHFSCALFMKSGAFCENHVLFMKSTSKATKTADLTQISHFDLVCHRVQREGQLGIS